MLQSNAGLKRMNLVVCSRFLQAHDSRTVADNSRAIYQRAGEELKLHLTELPNCAQGGCVMLLGQTWRGMNQGSTRRR